MADWDRRFLDAAFFFAQWSKDPSTQQGAVIVRPDKTIASQGFNGFPKGTSDDERLYEDRTEKYGRVMHAELNAILFSREDLTGYSLYTAPMPPCDRCAAAIIQSGIDRVVFPEAEVPERWWPQADRAERMFDEANVNYGWIEL